MPNEKGCAPRVGGLGVVRNNIGRAEGVNGANKSGCVFPQRV